MDLLDVFYTYVYTFWGTGYVRTHRTGSKLGYTNYAILWTPLLTPQVFMYTCRP